MEIITGHVTVSNKKAGRAFFPLSSTPGFQKEHMSGLRQEEIEIPHGVKVCYYESTYAPFT